MKENFMEGKELDGVLKIALGSYLWLSHRISVFPVGQIWEYWLILIQRESDSSEAQFPPLGICSFCCHKDCLGATINRTTRDRPFQEQCITATRKAQEFFWTVRLVFLSLSKWCWIKPPWLPWLYSLLDWMWELHSLFVIWKLPGRTVFSFMLSYHLVMDKTNASPQAHVLMFGLCWRNRIFKKQSLLGLSSVHTLRRD